MLAHGKASYAFINTEGKAIVVTSTATGPKLVLFSCEDMLEAERLSMLYNEGGFIPAELWCNKP